MPELDGWAVVAQLKADPATADVAVVFLSGRSGTADAVHALELGAQDFVRKPPQPAELLARVGAAMRTKQSHDALRLRADKLDVQGRTDALTGVRNRRHAEQHLAAAVRASSEERDLAVLLIDIDRFKAVNDVLGHAAGDQVIREVADRLRSTVRADDLVARWGGEEFLVVSRSSGTDTGHALGERLRRAVGSPPLRPAAGVDPLTVSIGGVSGRCGEAVTPEELLAEADRNLYRAKEAGRDRVVVSPLPAAEPAPEPPCDAASGG
jgi:two-component system cell cycle response regulator